MLAEELLSNKNDTTYKMKAFINLLILVLLSFLLSSLKICGQVRIQNLSLLNPDSNLLYIGIQNDIKVSGLVKGSKITI